jgi:hypothetical protein
MTVKPDPMRVIGLALKTTVGVIIALLAVTVEEVMVVVTKLFNIPVMVNAEETGWIERLPVPMTVTLLKELV